MARAEVATTAARADSSPCEHALKANGHGTAIASDLVREGHEAARISAGGLCASRMLHRRGSQPDACPRANRGGPRDLYVRGRRSRRAPDRQGARGGLAYALPVHSNNG